MPLHAKNENHVPREDLPYFIAATTSGLRRQLREADVPTGGLKYELYLRLRANGLRIYNDDRRSPESSDDESDSGAEDGEPDDDGGDEESSSSDEESSEDELNVVLSSSRRARKRKRKNDEGDIEDETEDDIEEPEAHRPTSLADMPAELCINIIKHLDAAGIFNFVLASPKLFLTGRVDAFILEAQGRRNAANRSGLSLLEWVVLQVGREADFRAAHNDLIQCVVNAYLVTYPSDSSQGRSPDARVKEIMFYLRHVGVNPVLGPAVREGEADIVHLLILMGEDVNQRVEGVQPLEEATVLANANGPSLLHMNRLQVVFALLAGGADTTSTRDDYPANKNIQFFHDPLAGLGENSSVSVPITTNARARVPLRGVPLAAEECRLRIDPDRMWYDEPTDHPTTWRVIHNPRGLTVRQFFGDERSPFIDRAIMALTLISTRTSRYPNFEGYHPSAPGVS